MSFMPAMTWRTEGISVRAPVKWRAFDGMMGAFWEAECHGGATGYYLAEDPRIMIFFDNVSGIITLSNSSAGDMTCFRPMQRAHYIPAGMPMWTRTETLHAFAHLNLHIHKDRLLRFLTQSIGRSAALEAMRRPVETQDVDAIEPLARLVVDELAQPTRHPIFIESLVGSIVAGLLDINDATGSRCAGRLTQAQMKKVVAHVESRGFGRVTVAEMASVVGLSESWFATVFKQTTGETPLQWKLARRIDMAKQMLLENHHPLAEIADRLGFSDQAHLTKAFRQVVGETPAAWRRTRLSA
ncbi:helix-turn-helix domain-containing protein [Chelativorans sp. ZYF759]|uniref:helix-turn-helix transcriptional regulator n=1 Tax=Chelativorans sp. ZYF759 TaxID=2692213 RepID=UPI0016930D76|nr:AraC family transcriptional regulator [Chelativorans sp. ZYF759]NMG37700.1 helix-turn-helix domain-containing protein [Chelativorans sp. ZYF759]